MSNKNVTNELDLLFDKYSDFELLNGYPPKVVFFTKPTMDKLRLKITKIDDIFMRCHPIYTVIGIQCVLHDGGDFEML